ncbi:shikimate dehydrogenase [Nakamurella sp. YIM 132087]|uniref:Shikimate dehydrogenase n=1 Tax=Nakamurella alba TaxID=2665158 RepID=A0A7K1FT25_9ACTN|nr:shikimate dehydrogenase [Nakamurella alba]MTD17307.1 shikimate dehydrogenase [Nakamurella alba]
MSQDSGRRAAVLGDPVEHSLSPALHRAGFRAAGLTDWRYERIRCDAAMLPALVREAGPEWVGFSVTMPGKAAAAEVATERSARVEVLGVANTLVRNISGGWMAENTDVDGVRGALQAAGVSGVSGALVLGGGHTARSACAALAEMGAASVILAGRRPESTAGCAELAAELGLAVQEIRMVPEDVAAVAGEVGVVISTVPAGGADQLAAALAPVPVLLDAIYHPWPTPLAEAGVPGRITVTGLDMLMHQAFRQNELFTGLPAPREAMRQGLLAAAGSALPLPVA